MSGFARKIKRDHLRAMIIAQARAEGCTCTPDITLPSTAEPGTVRVVTIAHDNDCPHATDNRSEAKRLVGRINTGEFDTPPEQRRKAKR